MPPTLRVLTPVTAPKFGFLQSLWGVSGRADANYYGEFWDMRRAPTSETPCIQHRHSGAAIALAYYKSRRAARRVGHMTQHCGHLLASPILARTAPRFLRRIGLQRFRPHFTGA